MKKITLIICIAVMFAFVGCGEVENNDPINNANNVVENDNNNNNNIEEPIDEIIEYVKGEEVITDDMFDMGVLQGTQIYEDKDFSEHYTINYMGRETNNPDIDKYSFVKDAYETAFNITFDFSPVSGTNNDMDLAAAADAIPECAWIYLGGSQKAWDLYESGLTRSIPMELIEEYAPYMWGMIEKDKSFDATMLVPGTEDEYYTIFAVREFMWKHTSGMAIRYDWLENLGVSPKGETRTLVDDYVYISDDAYLLNELSDLLYDFTFSDPDMNGENDTIGLATYGLKADDFGHDGILFSALGMKPGYVPDENGWAVPLIFSNENFEFFKQLGIWKELGVISPTFATETSTNLEQNWASGKYGVVSYTTQNIAWLERVYREDYENGAVPGILFNDNRLASIILYPGLKADDGSGGRGRAYGDSMLSANAGYFYVRSDVDDEKLKRILMVFDYMTANPDGVHLRQYGLRGLNWEVDNQGLIYYPDQEELPDNLKYAYAVDYFETPSIISTSNAVSPQVKGYYDGLPDEIEDCRIREEILTYADRGIWPYPSYAYVIDNVPVAWDEDLEWANPANTRAKNNAYKAARTALIENAADPDTIWDNLMDTLDSFGYQEYLVELNKNVVLRDEAFIDGIIITPAEKFPLD